MSDDVASRRCQESGSGLSSSARSAEVGGATLIGPYVAEQGDGSDTTAMHEYATPSYRLCHV
jgi:hypothetical protein